LFFFLVLRERDVKPGRDGTVTPTDAAKGVVPENVSLAATFFFFPFAVVCIPNKCCDDKTSDDLIVYGAYCGVTVWPSFLVPFLSLRVSAYS